jgi:hypothetical protein
MEKTYKDWEKEVDNKVWEIMGCSVYDLPDCCFADWFEDGLSACQAAKKAIRYSNGGEE